MCRGAAPQAQANDATASSVDSVEALTPAAMPLLDAAVVKSWCSGTQTVAKARDDAAAVNTVHVGAPASIHLSLSHAQQNPATKHL